MSEYLLGHGTRKTPQGEAMRSDQVKNSAGGFVWSVDEWTRLRRFLILGSEGGTYYASERQLTTENVQCVRQCLTDGPRLVREIVEISDSGRAPKNDPALYALAVAISLGDNVTKRLAAEALPKVARIGTHLYHFVAYTETMRGWGRTLRWAVGNWYDKNPDQLALQAVKYRQRDGWSHRDLLRLAHPKNDDPVISWIAHPDRADDLQLPELISAFEDAQASPDPKRTSALIRGYNLPREAVIPEHLNDPEVWRALLDVGMPLTALMRNLATMTRHGVLSGEYLRVVTKALDDAGAIRKARLHPLNILAALRTYASGRGFRGQNTWVQIPAVTDALDAAFYLAFDNVETTGKRHLLGVDVSGSMASGNVAGSPLTPREAAVAMALVTLHAEPDTIVMGFTGGFVPLPLSRRQRLDDAVRSVSRLPFERTDCAIPMIHASREYLDVDTFVIYTDNETWAGSIHPKQALDFYRQRKGINARSAVVGMVSNGFTIADPIDQGMMDCVGFDTATPQIIADFSAGRI